MNETTMQQTQLTVFACSLWCCHCKFAIQLQSPSPSNLI